MSEARQILLVDDDITTLRVLETRLKSLGYAAPLTCTTGEDAIERALSHRPSLIFMDIKLGQGIDGIDAAEEIGKHLAVPIFLISSYTEKALIRRAHAIHPAGFITKPVTSKNLIAAVRLADCYTQPSSPSHSLMLETLFVGLSETINHFQTATLLVDHESRVLFANAAAERLFERSTILRIRNDRLSALTEPSTSRLRRAVKMVAGSAEKSAYQSLAVHSVFDKRPLEIVVTSANDYAISGVRAAIATVFILDGVTTSDSTESILIAQYGLTDAEARFTRVFIEAISLRQAAAVLSITYKTARTHLQHVFRKTGTSSQGELIHLIDTGPAGLIT